MFVGGEGLICADPPTSSETQPNCERWVKDGLTRGASSLKISQKGRTAVPEDKKKAAEKAPQPPPAAEREELSDDDVDKVAGGEGPSPVPIPYPNVYEKA